MASMPDNEQLADTLPIEPETLDEIADKWRGIATSERPTRRLRSMRFTDHDLDLIVEAYS